MSLCFLVANAQLKVLSNGNVGIGTSAVPNQKVHVMSNNQYQQFGLAVNKAVTDLSYTLGMYGTVDGGSSMTKFVGVRGYAQRETAYSEGRTIGVWGGAGNATDGWNFAVWGELIGTNGGAAIYGTIPGRGEFYVGSAFWAGFFRGNVFMEELVGVKQANPSYEVDVNGTVRAVNYITSSDMSLKKEVAPITNGLNVIKQINGITFKLKSPEELGQKNVMKLDTGEVVVPLNTRLSDENLQKVFSGLSAQELQKILPNLVTKDKDGKLSVSYLELIPYLIEAIKEQQIQIEELKKLVDSK
jgi:hypothetical protein